MASTGNLYPLRVKRPCMKSITLSSRHCHPSVLVSPAKSAIDRYIIRNQLIQLLSLVFSQKGSAPRSIHFHPELLALTWPLRCVYRKNEMEGNMHFSTCSFGSKFPLRFCRFRTQDVKLLWKRTCGHEGGVNQPPEQNTLFLLDGVYI